MQRLEVSGAVRLIYRLLGVQGLTLGDIKNWVEEFKIMASVASKKLESNVRNEDTRKH